MKGFIQKLFKPKTQFVTVVSGLPRSGTSMMMKMLEAGGLVALTDELRTADVDNPKGYYEFERVKKLSQGDTEWLPLAEGKVVKIISALLRFLPPSHEYRVVFMRRHMSEILASQRKMLAHRGEDAQKMDDEEMSQSFEKHLLQVEQWLASQANVSVLYVHYTDLVTAPEAQAKKLNDFLGLGLDVAKMAEVVDPHLYRNREKAG